MSSSWWILILLLDVIIAYAIGKFQQANGYTFYKSFVGAIIGLIGLTVLAVKAFS